MWKIGQGNEILLRAAPLGENSMIELPEFAPLSVTASGGPPTRSLLERVDHLLVVTAGARESALARLPQGKQLATLLARATRNGGDLASSRAGNARATGLTAAAFRATSTFTALTWAGKALRECLRDKPRSLAIACVGLDAAAERCATDALLAAAGAAAFSLPEFKAAKKSAPARLTSLRLLTSHGAGDLDAARARALGNNVARWFTALPPNVLTAAAYRDAIERLAKTRRIGARFLGERELRRLGAGAFLAVARGNAARDAGIMHLRYRPRGQTHGALALVGKGVLFDTGGTNLKPFLGMLDMHTDMAGSAVALGTLLALAEQQAPYGVDAWLAITENRLSPDAYKSQDVVTAANGTTIQVIHTDAEGRMVLADTLALAAREKPSVIIDYATLTGACVAALTERYSGVFSNRVAANALLHDAGVASGERVWPFPMDEDYDELLKSDVADIKQCATENAGDHILGARFLSRFVPKAIPWMHVDLSAGQHKGGLAHIPTEITGFGVRLTLELLRTSAPDELARRLVS
ncbi:MAG TPA: leucyl aminopeptidase family protein [Gammaproteobacteria bacterium]|nr:leucyl aminopeptidase family protein [Gammaproteobacteria bacterium]